MGKYVYVSAEVEVDLSEFDTDDLIEELENRGQGDNEPPAYSEMIQKVWMNRRLGKDYQKELDDLIYWTIGKVI